MKCKLCGHENPHGAIICDACGTILPKEEEKKADAPADDAEKKPEIVIEKAIEINPKKED